MSMTLSVRVMSVHTSKEQPAAIKALYECSLFFVHTGVAILSHRSQLTPTATRRNDLIYA